MDFQEKSDDELLEILNNFEYHVKLMKDLPVDDLTSIFSNAKRLYKMNVDFFQLQIELTKRNLIHK